MENEDFERWLRVVSDADPDLIVALETDSRWAKEIERLYPSYPHRVEQVQDNYYGMLLLSRPRLIQPEVRFLVQEDVPSIHTQVEVGGVQTVEIHALHPRPPEPVREQDAAPRDAELVIAARMVGGSNRPAIVIGDLNDVAWSYTTRLFRKLSHLLDPRRGRGLYNTFHARSPLIRLPLDHVFHSEHFRLVDLRVLDNVGSDHFPVFAEFSIESDAAEMQEAPDAEASERREAEQRKQRAESREN